jgi:putative transposase
MVLEWSLTESLFCLDRDWNAAINILNLAVSTVGHTGTWILDPKASGDSTTNLAWESCHSKLSLRMKNPHALRLGSVK